MRSFAHALRTLAAVLMLAAPQAHAIDASPARLDFLDSPAVIGGGQWPLDAGFPLPPGPHAATPSRFTSQFASQFASLDIPLRIGQAMELHVAAANDTVEPPLESANDRLRRLHGFTDVSLGAQWRVRGGDAGWLPGVAWLADVDASMGSPAFRARDVRPSLRATAQWALPQQMTLGLMPGVYRDRGDGILTWT